MICPRCGARLPAAACECRGCGMPTAFMDSDAGLAGATGDAVVEPEVLDSLDEVERTRFAANAAARPPGGTLGPGCGCVGLPIAALAGLIVTSAVALLWALKLVRVPFSLVRIAQRARRGSSRS